MKRRIHSIGRLMLGSAFALSLAAYAQTSATQTASSAPLTPDEIAARRAFAKAQSQESIRQLEEATAKMMAESQARATLHGAASRSLDPAQQPAPVPTLQDLLQAVFPGGIPGSSNGSPDAASESRSALALPASIQIRGNPVRQVDFTSAVPDWRPTPELPQRLSPAGVPEDLTNSLDGIVLSMERWNDDASDGKYISFNTQPGVAYNVEESTNLIDWSVYDTLVAEDTNLAFFVRSTDTHFYRVAQQDPRIQFLDWGGGAVEEFLHYDVWTSIQGTYHMELYADGQLVYQHDGTVPSSGNLGVYDGGYDPTQWPNAGFYAVDVWQLRVTVTPAVGANGAGAGGGPASAQAPKKFRRPYASRTGLTIQMYNAFTGSYMFQDELDEFLLGDFQACGQVTREEDLNGAFLDWSIDRTALPKLTDSASWFQFRYDIYHGIFSDLHYFGHGAKDHLGNGPVAQQLEMWVMDRSPTLATNKMRYVALDGCQTAQKTDFLKAWVGYDAPVSASKKRTEGWLPRFGWGWTDKKNISFINQGTLLYNHFSFVADYYNKLTHRDPNTGYLDFTYAAAISFAQHPHNAGVDQTVYDNSEGNSIKYVGCYDCFFDQ